LGNALASGLAGATGALIQLTSKVFGGVRERAGASYDEFRARPEHARWRAYALGFYGLIAATTFAGQFYTSNMLTAYVRVQPIELPASTQIFVRNDSDKSWMRVRITLNGIYSFDAPEVKPGAHVLLPVNKFAITDTVTARPTYAPRNVVPRQLVIDCDRGRLQLDLTP
jgi:hypothetical protein